MHQNQSLSARDLWFCFAIIIEYRLNTRKTLYFTNNHSNKYKISRSESQKSIVQMHTVTNNAQKQQTVSFRYKNACQVLSFASCSIFYKKASIHKVYIDAIECMSSVIHHDFTVFYIATYRYR